MPQAVHRVAVLITLVLWLADANPGFGQEVRWRRDVAAAKREATETGRPLFYDFGTEACSWCKKLDVTTFRTAAVARLLNDEFIPVKIDAEREPKLTQTYGVQSYPTLVIAASEGKVIDQHVGYADAAEMMRFLERANAKKPVVTKPTVAQDTFVRCQVINKIEPSQPATILLVEPSKAADLLALAKKDFESQCYTACLERCRAIAASYSTSPEAEEARKLSDKIAGDPAISQQARDQLNAQMADLNLRRGRALFKERRYAEAAEYLNQVIRTCPGTGDAKAAEELLGQVPADAPGQGR